MKTEWDYSDLADAYLKRPNYSEPAIEAMLSIFGVKKQHKVCDIGAGVAHLTLMLADRDYDVVAVEPNDSMRRNGIVRTQKYENVSWFEGTGENTGQATGSFDFVTFGSSFNVCNRQEALKETARLLKPKGWFACMWNNRNLEDKIQSNIENIIKTTVPDYDYGTRRETQTEVIVASKLFGPVVHISSNVQHQQSISECVEAWRSHATLERQTGSLFPKVVSEIEKYLKGLNKETIEIPYTTNVWVAQLK